MSSGRGSGAPGPCLPASQARGVMACRPISPSFGIPASAADALSQATILMTAEARDGDTVPVDYVDYRVVQGHP